MQFKSKSLQRLQYLHSFCLKMWYMCLECQLLWTITYSLSLQLGPIITSIFIPVTFFEISRLILCTSSLTTKTHLHTWKSGKGNTINSTSAWDLESIMSRGASVLLTAGWTDLFIFPFLCHVVHVSLELFACHLRDWQWGAKPVSRVACLLFRNSG